ncbi:glycosyltransferase family 1 protein [Xylariomycetidae sp. FL2044]|nr:glycosyltransferase family 1 protein [Xylariomycetidae sp. FL2044]
MAEDDTSQDQEPAPIDGGTNSNSNGNTNGDANGNSNSNPGETSQPLLPPAAAPAASSSTSAARLPDPTRPLILVVCHSLSGHLFPLIRISAALCARGWAVHFLGPSAHRRRIVASGAIFLPLSPSADLDDRRYYAEPPVPGYEGLPWWDRVMVDLRKQCLEPLPAQWECVKAALEMLVEKARRERHQVGGGGRGGQGGGGSSNANSNGTNGNHSVPPQAEVLIIAEAFFHGILPLKFGAPLPSRMSPPKTLCVSITPPVIRSRDCPPFGYPFPFDASEEGRRRNEGLWRGWERRTRELTALLDDKLKEAGADRGVGEVFLSGVNYTSHDRIMQLGVPGFEYPRSDFPAHFRFVGLAQEHVPATEGTLPAASATAAEPDFAWWEEIVSNSALARDDPARKKVVVVAQGTVEINPQDLIIPTIQAFAPSSPSSADDNNILVIAILGWKDADLFDLDISVPRNARVADYLSYDAVLAHADAWVHNAGFGAVNHGIARGVPMVVAGEGMDKTENARRVARAGLGVDLGTPKPTAGQVRDAVVKVLRDARYAERARALRRETEALDCFGLIHDELLALAGADTTE